MKPINKTISIIISIVIGFFFFSLHPTKAETVIFGATGAGTDLHILNSNYFYWADTTTNSSTSNLTSAQTMVHSSSPDEFYMKLSITLDGFTYYDANDCNHITATTSVNDWSFDPISVPANSNFTIKGRLYTDNVCTSYYTDDFYIRGQQPKINVYNDLRVVYGDNTPQDLSPYLRLGSGLMYGSLSFTYPTSGQSIGIGNQSFTGTCPIVGQDRLSLKRSGYDYKPESVNFTDDCKSDHTFDITWNAELGIHSVSVYDINFLDDPNFLESPFIASVDYIGNKYDVNGYNLFIAYPECDKYFCNKLKPSENWIFKFGYNIPYGVDRSTVNFELNSCTDGWADCSTSIYDVPLTTADPDDFRTIRTNEGDVEVELDTPHYYKVALVIGSTIKLDYTFVTQGYEGNDQINPHDPDKLDCGWRQWICDFFIPPFSDMTRAGNALKDEFKSRAPFAWFFVIAKKFQDLSYSDTAQSFNLNLHTSIANVNMPLFNTNDTHLKAIGDTLKPYITYSLWLSFLVFAYSMIVIW